MNANYRTIGVKSVEQSLAEAGAVMKAVMNGTPVQPKTPEYNFTSFEAFRKALPVQRFNLLKVSATNTPVHFRNLLP